MSPIATAELERPAATSEEEAADLDAQKAEEARADLNPCRVCASSQDDAPDALHRAELGVLHCFKCGYRPGTAVPAGTLLAGATTAAQFDSAIASLRKGIVTDILDAIRGGASLDQIAVDLPTGQSPAVVPATAPGAVVPPVAPVAPVADPAAGTVAPR
jgi:hypothetical protein